MLIINYLNNIAVCKLHV